MVITYSCRYSSMNLILNLFWHDLVGINFSLGYLTTLVSLLYLYDPYQFKLQIFTYTCLYRKRLKFHGEKTFAVFADFY